jgi:hypothetical protein
MGWITVMSEDEKGSDVPDHAGVPGMPTDAELAKMSRAELVTLGGRIDGVETVFKEARWPVEGTKAEKRAERSVARWLLFGGLCGLALLVVFLFWPWEYKPYGSDGEFLYSLATPLYGLTFGLSILAIGIGAVLFQKKFIPEEITIQDRHDGRSSELERKATAANLSETLDASTIKRRKLIGVSLGIGLGAFGLGTAVAFVGGLIKNPWKPVVGGGAGEGSCRRPRARLRCCGRRHGPRSSTARPFTSPAPPASRARRPSSRCGPKTSTQAAWRPCSRSAIPTVTEPPLSRRRSSPRSRWACATPSC